MKEFKEILESAEKAGVDYIIAEQDSHPERSSMEDARLGRGYLKTLNI